MEIQQHVSITEKNNTIHVTPNPGTSLDKLKPILYSILNKYEPKKQVRIHDIPFCLLPDAFENIIQTQGKHVDACNDCSLKLRCKGLLPDHIPGFSHAPFQTSPRELAIEVNRVCAFKCHFCFYHTFSEANENNTIPKEKIFELIDDMVAMDIKNLRLFGGDPLFHKDIIEILDYAKQRNITTIMNTNGLFKSKEFMQKIIDRTDKFIISLHGFDEESEQALTGRGDLLKRVVKGLFELGHTVPDKVICSTLITTYLLNHFEQYKHIVKASGVKTWALNRPLFLKKMFEEYDWLQFNKEDLLPLAEKIIRTNSTNNFVTVMNNYPHCFFPEHLRSVVWHNNSCNGVHRMFYDVDDYFKPTPSININLGTSLKESWDKNPFNDLGSREFVPEKCRSCDLFMNCLGGSRSQAHMFHDDYYARDPYMKW